MMVLIIQILAVGMVIVLPLYLLSYSKLLDAIKKEYPDWLEVRGSLSFFYPAPLKVADPNLTVRVLAIAFSRRIYSLASDGAVTNGLRVRYLLITFSLLFLSVIAIGIFSET